MFVYTVILNPKIMKIAYFLSAVAACIITACSNDDTNTTVTRNIFNAFNAHDWQAMLSYYADDAVFEDPAFADPVHDRSTMREHHQQLQSLFPDIYDSVRNVSASGERVVVEFISMGTSQDGRRFSLPICTVLTFKNGKVVRDATYYSNCP